jgi:hypothetical protein
VVHPDEGAPGVVHEVRQRSFRRHSLIVFKNEFLPRLSKNTEKTSPFSATFRHRIEVLQPSSSLQGFLFVFSVLIPLASVDRFLCTHLLNLELGPSMKKREILNEIFIFVYILRNGQR